jgi:hypothetical protein
MKCFTLARWLSLLYLVPALVLFVLLLVCFGGAAVCPSRVYALPLSPILRALEWPWGEIAPPAIFAGPVFGKLFVLAAIATNGAIVFAIAKAGVWLASARSRRSRALPLIGAARGLGAALVVPFDRAYRYAANAWRRDPPRLVGSMAALVYAIPALYVYLDELGCQGMLCDLGVAIAALPWSLIAGVPLRGAGRFILLAMIATNTALLYLVVGGITRFATRKTRRPGDLPTR